MPLKDKSIHLIFVVFRSVFTVDGHNVDMLGVVLLYVAKWAGCKSSAE